MFTKYRQAFMQMAAYALVAVVGLAADFTTVYLLTEIVGWYYLLSVCAGFMVGLVLTFVLSNKFVFGNAKMSKKRALLLFGLIGLIGLGLLNALVWFMTDLLGIYYLISKAIATIFVFFWNYIARKQLYE